MRLLAGGPADAQQVKRAQRSYFEPCVGKMSTLDTTFTLFFNSELESQASLAQVFATVASRDDTEDELLGHDGNENEDEAGKSDDASGT